MFSRTANLAEMLEKLEEAIAPALGYRNDVLTGFPAPHWANLNLAARLLLKHIKATVTCHLAPVRMAGVHKSR